MSFVPAPLPPTWSPANLGNPKLWGTPEFSKDLVQVSIANLINDGEINGTFTQAEFDSMYSATLGNASMAFSQAVPAWQAALVKAGIGTETGPAGTYNK